MRLIDADNVVFELKRMLDIVDERNAKPDQKEEFKTIRTYVEWTKKVIHDTPTIDAVEVVRCKDCKHWKGNDEPIPWSDDNVFIEVPCETKPMEFCSMGDRKEE